MVHGTLLPNIFVVFIFIRKWYFGTNVGQTKIVMCFFFSFSFDIGNDIAATYVSALEEVISSKDPQLIMCILTNNRLDCYSAIKKKCCVDRAGEFFVLLQV
jgi:hypothetical protein